MLNRLYRLCNCFEYEYCEYWAHGEPCNSATKDECSGEANSRIITTSSLQCATTHKQNTLTISISEWCASYEWIIQVRASIICVTHPIGPFHRWKYYYPIFDIAGKLKLSTEAPLESAPDVPRKLPSKHTSIDAQTMRTNNFVYLFVYGAVLGRSSTQLWMPHATAIILDAVDSGSGEGEIEGKGERIEGKRRQEKREKRQK